VRRREARDREEEEGREEEIREKEGEGGGGGWHGQPMTTKGERDYIQSPQKTDQIL